MVHFAANALVGESMTNPSKYFRNNVCHGLKLLDATVAAGVKKFVFSSTCATYGPPDRVPMTEDLPQRPINPYGESKLMFEKMLQWYERIHGLEFVAFRYFNAAGASEKFGEHHRIETHLIPNTLSVALGRSACCEVFGTDYPTPDGTCIRDYIHIIDLAQAHILALQPGGRGFIIWAMATAIRCASHQRLRENYGPAHSHGGKAAASGRPAHIGGVGGKSHARAGLEAGLPEAGANRGRRLALASGASQRDRLPGLTVPRRYDGADNVGCAFQIIQGVIDEFGVKRNGPKNGGRKPQLAFPCEFQQQGNLGFQMIGYTDDFRLFVNHILVGRNSEGLFGQPHQGCASEPPRQRTAASIVSGLPINSNATSTPKPCVAS